MVVASGTSTTHIKALADNVEEELEKENIHPHKIEGYNSNSWILMDYLDVIVNIFTILFNNSFSIFPPNNLVQLLW